MNTTYPSDLTDAEWECLQRSLLESHSHCRTRRHSLRSSLNAIFYVLRTSCPWRDVPSRFPPGTRWFTIFAAFACEDEGLGCSPRCETRSVSAWAGIPTRVRPSWMRNQ